MPRIGIRVTDDFHDEIKALAAVDGVSVSDFVRRAIENEMLQRRTVSDTVSRESLLILKSQIESLQAQLETKDDQIRALTQSLDQAQQLQAMQAQTNQTLTDRLTAIEDRSRRSWWQRLLNRS
jgi:predicted DNA binding CopG/RHH family protein